MKGRLRVMILPSPSVLDRLIQERRERLDRMVVIPPAPAAPLRLRVGHALIAAGMIVSGERTERSVSSDPLPKAA
jgi:hypothetical protein